MTVKAIRENLATFGLSEKETDAYLAVLQAGEATTREVSQAANVSQGYVYEIAGALEERGLVRIDETATPTVLRARPPEDAVASLTSRLDELGERIDDLYAEPADASATVEVVHSRATVRKRARRTLDEADHEAFIIIPAPEFEHLQGKLADAQDRGIFTYLLLVAPIDKADLDVDWDRYADIVRTWPKDTPVNVIADGVRGIMGGHGILAGRHGGEYALGFTQRDIGSAFYGNAVSNFWPMGETLFLTEPDDLPETYIRIRNAVANATMYLNSGYDIVADITVRNIKTNEITEYDGVPIVDTNQSFIGEASGPFPLENNLVVETPEGQILTGEGGGGVPPFHEGYAAESVTLFLADEYDEATR